MHLVESAVAMQFELDPDRPTWRRIVSPTRKALGDNPDAIYFEAAVNPKYEYRVTGNLAGAVLGALIIGFIQQITDNRIGAEWTPAIVFAYLVLIMVFRPRGLLGEETREAG